MRTILLFSLLIAATCCGQIMRDDTVYHGRGTSVNPLIDTIPMFRPHYHDTTYWYPAKIDTVRVERDSVIYHTDTLDLTDGGCMFYSDGGGCLNGDHYRYRKFWKHTTDTTWAKKVQVWLTPEELGVLRRIIRDNGDTAGVLLEWIHND